MSRGFYGTCVRSLPAVVARKCFPVCTENTSAGELLRVFFAGSYPCCISALKLGKEKKKKKK